MNHSENESKSPKRKNVLVITSFEIEVVGRGSYTFQGGVDLSKLDPKVIIEDCNEIDNSPED